MFAGAALSLLAAGLGIRQWYISQPDYGIPYYANFKTDADDHWTALGGTFEVANGAMRNDSNDRGAKALTGSSHWKDYAVEGDVELLGSGSVGLLARVNEAELGENSYKGYWAGVRTGDNSLVVATFDFAYHEAAKVSMPDVVHPFRWYHVKLEVNGCMITASASGPGMREVKTSPVNDPECFRSGTIGLRSNGTGGVWRNVRVLRVGSADVQQWSAADVVSAAEPSPQKSTGRPMGEVIAVPPPQPVASLHLLSLVGSPVATVRGAVVLTRPALFVQDSTGGGVEVQTQGETPLKIGDEVEVTGEVNLERFSPVIRKAQVRQLSQAIPASPMILTANQIAAGQWDGRFIQVEGRLRTISTGKDSLIAMELDSGTQSFRAVLPAGRSRSHWQDLALESRVRLRGISVVDPRFNQAGEPFTVLVRSAEDVDVVAGPPWWRPSTLILAGLVALGLVFTLNHLYLLARHWRLQAVAEERERLAHEIHDTLAQSFAGIGFQLQAIRNRLPGGGGALEAQVEQAMQMARTSHEEARRSIATLQPVSLGQLALLPALRECAERLVKNGNLTVETYGEDCARAIPPRVKDAFFRIGQEAIANSIRHARPGTIRIGLERSRTSVSMAVEDDGEGFVATSDRAGFGLLGMRKRAESISATLVVKSAPGSGTRVEVKASVGSRFLPVRLSHARPSSRGI